MDRPQSPASKANDRANLGSSELLEGLAVLEKEFNLSCSDVAARQDCQREQENAINHSFATTQVRKQLTTWATLERVLGHPGEPETSMTETAMVTDAELARARHDMAFRHRLAAEALELLLREHNRLRAVGADRTHRKQMYEGVDLAIKLLDLLQRIAKQAKNARGQT